MTLEEFREAYADRPGKFEFVDGRVITIFDPEAPLEQADLVYERSIHGLVKTNVATVLAEATRSASLPLIVFGGGMSVEISGGRSRAPDALAIHRSTYDPDAIFITAPVFLCEVLSPSTAKTDLVVKVREYFALPSVRAYLIVDPSNRVATLHSRPRTASEPTVETSDDQIILEDLVDGMAPLTLNLSAFWPT